MTAMRFDRSCECGPSEKHRSHLKVKHRFKVVRECDGGSHD